MPQDLINRVRRLSLALPETSERRSHGEPTFFVRQRVFVMIANNHHGDGRVAIWVPAPPGVQAGLVATAPTVYFRPPYVGGKGWLGIVLARIKLDTLRAHIHLAWELRAPPTVLKAYKP